MYKNSFGICYVQIFSNFYLILKSLKTRRISVFKVAMMLNIYHNSRVSCQQGPIRHAYAWQIGPFCQETLEFSGHILHKTSFIPMLTYCQYCTIEYSIEIPPQFKYFNWRKGSWNFHPMGDDHLSPGRNELYHSVMDFLSKHIEWP